MGFGKMGVGGGGGGGPEVDYSTSYGHALSDGYRVDHIAMAVESLVGLGGGSIDNFVDGSESPDAGASFFFAGPWLAEDRIVFDFGAVDVRIDGATLQKSTAGSQGEWKFRRWTGAAWIDAGAPFDWTGIELVLDDLDAFDSVSEGVDGAGVKWCMEKVSGVNDSGPWVQEALLRISRA